MRKIALGPEAYLWTRAEQSVRFFKKVETNPETGCWNWTACLATTGYGKCAVDGRSMPAHRVAYTNLVEPIPPELVLDHKCRNRRCVNPDHLRVVTWRENTLENNVSPIAQNAVKTHCPKGHLLVGDNVYQHPRGRDCMQCRRERNAELVDKLKAERRARGSRGAFAERTECPVGHPLSGENLYIRPDTGARGCKECRRRQARESAARKAEKST